MSHDGEMEKFLEQESEVLDENKTYRPTKSVSKILLMAAMFGSIGGDIKYPKTKSKRSEEMTNKEKGELLESRKAKFVKDLADHNKKLTANPHWSGFNVYLEIIIWAYNEKNAQKTFEYLLKKNNLAINRNGK